MVSYVNKKSILGPGRLGWQILIVLLCSPAGWCQQTAPAREVASNTVGSHGTEFPDSELLQPEMPQQPQPQKGSITGRVADQSGANVGGASVILTQEGQGQAVEIKSGADGEFAFTGVAPGPFKIVITSEGLTPQEISGTLHPGEAYAAPLVTLAIASQETTMNVGLPPEELADVQTKEEEKQRVLGVVPNFYTVYVPNPAPLSTKNKFALAWKSASDPVTLVGVGVLAGFEQASNRWSGYGQGAQGYGKRYGAAYVDVFSATYIGAAVLPSIFKQDPRYFYKGKGSKVSRLIYALGNSVICKGDNGNWQPNYSFILGSFASGGLAKLYYPAVNSQGASFVVSSALIRLGETSLAGVLQEFVFPKLTKNRPASSTP